VVLWRAIYNTVVYFLFRFDTRPLRTAKSNLQEYLFSLTPNRLSAVKTITLARGLCRFHSTAEYSPRGRFTCIQRNTCAFVLLKKSLEKQANHRIKEDNYNFGSPL